MDPAISQVEIGDEREREKVGEEEEESEEGEDEAPVMTDGIVIVVLAGIRTPRVRTVTSATSFGGRRWR